MNVRTISPSNAASHPVASGQTPQPSVMCLTSSMNNPQSNRLFPSKRTESHGPWCDGDEVMYTNCPYISAHAVGSPPSFVPRAELAIAWITDGIHPPILSQDGTVTAAHGDTHHSAEQSRHLRGCWCDDILSDRPIWPYSFEPHAQTLPASSRASEWFSPAATSTMGPLSPRLLITAGILRFRSIPVTIGYFLQ